MKLTKKSAQTLIEYALILTLIAAISITVLGRFGKSVSKTGNAVSGAYNSTGASGAVDYCKALGNSGYDSDAKTCN